MASAQAVAEFSRALGKKKIPAKRDHPGVFDDFGASAQVVGGRVERLQP